MRAGSDRPGGDTGGVPPGLRGHARQHQGQRHPAGFFGEDRIEIRQGPADLADGPWDPTPVLDEKTGDAVPGRDSQGEVGKLEKELLERPWQEARPEVGVKLPAREDDLYVWVQSRPRVGKERSMRWRKLKRLWARLKELQRQRPSYENLLLKLGAAKKEAGRVWSLVDIELPEPPDRKAGSRRVTFKFGLDREKLSTVRRREGRYLLRTNLVETDPGKLWEFYLLLVEVEAAFKNLKGDLAVRPIFHRREDRIEAHIFLAFLTYCIHVTLRQRLRQRAPGLTVRQALDSLGAMQMLDVHFPTTDGRELIFTRYTQPEREQQLLLSQLGWRLPKQPPPRITAKRAVKM